MRLIFFGSSDFSLPSLQACLESGCEVVLVITTPDQKKGRGLQQFSNSVRQFCLKHRVPCEAFGTLKNPQFLEAVKALKPDIFVVASYGKLIPSAWIELPAHRLNVHPSLLPKYRGAAPLNWPILEGDNETGLSIAEITAKLDSGDIFYQEKVPLDLQMDSERLGSDLAQRARGGLLRMLSQIQQGIKLKRKVQEESKASMTRKLTKEDGLLDWYEDAQTWSRKIRGLKPWPGTYIFFEKELLGIMAAELAAGTAAGEPGTLLSLEKDQSIKVQTVNGVLRIMQVKPAGKKTMKAADFIRGRRLQPGFNFFKFAGGA